MIEPVSLKVRFKGSRDYLQGADLHDSICSILDAGSFSDPRKIDLTFHKIAREGLNARLIERGNAPMTTPAATAVFQFEADGKGYAVLLAPNGLSVNERTPYPEEEIFAACKFLLDEQRVDLSAPVPFSNIEIFVAMNKALLQRLFPNEAGKWIFTRLRLAETVWNRGLEGMSVRLEANMNFVITKSALLADGKVIGHLFFSLVR